MTVAGMRDLEAELAAPKYAHVERERRWLVNGGERPSLGGLPHVRIDDRYIEGTRLRLRRMTCSESGATTWKLTKKYEANDPAARPIVTAYLSEREHALLAGLDAAALSKRRYTLNHGGSEWCLDCFDGPLAGFECLEAEAEDDNALRSLEPPHWAGIEITADPRYQGAALARGGLPESD